MVAPATGSDGKKRIAASLGPSACSWCCLFRCCGGFTPRNRLRKQLAMTHIAMCSCSSLRDCFGLSFLLCSAMAEEPPSAEETNRLAADILFACHILIENIQGYEALVPQELQQNFQLRRSLCGQARAGGGHGRAVPPSGGHESPERRGGGKVLSLVPGRRAVLVRGRLALLGRQ